MLFLIMIFVKQMTDKCKIIIHHNNATNANNLVIGQKIALKQRNLKLIRLFQRKEICKTSFVLNVNKWAI